MGRTYDQASFDFADGQENQAKVEILCSGEQRFTGKERYGAEDR